MLQDPGRPRRSQQPVGLRFLGHHRAWGRASHAVTFPRACQQREASNPCGRAAARNLQTASAHPLSHGLSFCCSNTGHEQRCSRRRFRRPMSRRPRSSGRTRIVDVNGRPPRALPRLLLNGARPPSVSLALASCAFAPILPEPAQRPVDLLSLNPRVLLRHRLMTHSTL